MVLLGGWVVWWLVNPNIGSATDKDLAAPVFLSLAALAPFVVVLGVAGGLGANGRPKLERLSYIAFAVVAVLIGNAFTYFPDDLFYCNDLGPTCSTSITERLIGLVVLETAALLHLGFAHLVLGAIHLMSRSDAHPLDEQRDGRNQRPKVTHHEV